MERRTRLTRRTRMRRTEIGRRAKASRTSQQRTGRGPEWAHARRRALIRDDYRCVRCDQAAVDVHHRRGCGMGGSADPQRDRLANLVSLCWFCHHEWVHGPSTRRVAERFGFIVLSWQDPAEVPLLTTSGPFLLTDEGGFTHTAVSA